jgi:hypothetical protein
VSGVFSASQLRHKAKGERLFFSPEAMSVYESALKNDPSLAYAFETGLLDHALSGWKNLQPKGIDGRTGKPISKFALAVDDAVEMTDEELVQLQINEVKNALNNKEQIDGYRQLSPDHRALVSNLIKKHIAGGDIGEIGGLGTNQRRYPKDYKDAALAGELIPVNFEPGQKQERGVKIISDVVEGVDVDTGGGIYGVEIDAMHRIPAAVRPDLVADVDNIKPGPKSLNQSDGKREGEDLINSRKARLVRLQADRFQLENGIPAKQRGGTDKRTNRENLYQTKIDNILKDVRSEAKGKAQDFIKNRNNPSV